MRFLSAACIPKRWFLDAGGARAHPSLAELILAGKESYYIVSQFNLFEYEKEAPLFARLADSFERCILGLALVREDLNKRKALPPTRELGTCGAAELARPTTRSQLRSAWTACCMKWLEQGTAAAVPIDPQETPGL